jgi:hypothetical protein
MKRHLAFVLILLGIAAAAPALAAPFDNWAAIVVAGDNRAHSGAPSDVFDNARRDIAKELERIGFAADHIRQFAVQPEKDAATDPLPSTPQAIYNSLNRLTQEATAGCFVYVTSHGAPLGLAMSGALIGQRMVGDILDRTCGTRPTVIVISACYSGMFIPVIRADNRLIITAARADRTSFGCSEDLQYTFFDQCFLESLPMVSDFVALAHTAQECVAKREMVEGATPPSEPQLYVGASVMDQLPMFGMSGS